MEQMAVELFMKSPVPGPVREMGMNREEKNPFPMVLGEAVEKEAKEVRSLQAKEKKVENEKEGEEVEEVEAVEKEEETLPQEKSSSGESAIEFLGFYGVPAAEALQLLEQLGLDEESSAKELMALLSFEGEELESFQDSLQQLLANQNRESAMTSMVNSLLQEEADGEELPKFTLNANGEFQNKKETEQSRAPVMKEESASPLEEIPEETVEQQSLQGEEAEEEEAEFAKNITSRKNEGESTGKKEGEVFKLDEARMAARDRKADLANFIKENRETGKSKEEEGKILFTDENFEPIEEISRQQTIPRSEPLVKGGKNEKIAMAETALKSDAVEVESVKTASKPTEANPVERPARTASFLEGRVLDQVTEKIPTFLRSGKDEIRVRLNPPSLGSLHMKVQGEGTHLKVTMVVENQFVKNVMETNIQEIKQALAEQGLTTDQFSVDVGGDNSFWNQGEEGSENLAGGKERGDKSSPSPDAPLLSIRPYSISKESSINFFI